VNVTIQALPVANIVAAGPTSFCAYDSVLLSAGTGAGLTYQWTRNGNSISGATSSSYMASMAGSYSVTVTNGNSCSATSSGINVAVLSVPSSAVTPPANTMMCPGGSITLNGAGTGTSYQWQLGGNDIAGATNANYTATASGTYTLVVANGNGCIAISSPIQITTLTAGIMPNTPQTICSGGYVTLNAPAGVGLTYQWARNGTNLANAINASYNATQAGTYTVTVGAGNCNATSAPVAVTAIPVPTTNIVITALNHPVANYLCPGDTTKLENVGGTGLSYQWKNGGVNIPGATSAIYYATAPGGYVLEITNGNGCSATSLVTVISNGLMPVAVTQISGPTTFCQGNLVILTDSASTSTPSAYTIQWQSGGVNISGATGPNLPVTTSGSYSYILKSLHGCKDTSSSINVVVNPLPVPIITVTGVVNLSTGSFASYQWAVDGTDIPGANTGSIIATTDGNYSVTVTDTNGCIGTSQVTPVIGVAIPKVSMAAKQVKIAPNPTTGIVKIISPVRIKVYVSSIEGRLLLSMVGDTQIDLGDFANGIYVVRITDMDGNILLVDKIHKGG